jgi:hypothetical protein
MSLIICSSSQQEYDKSSKGQTGIEDPSSFQNFFTSPVKVEKDSEVALVSLKCARDIDRIVVNPKEGFFLYWGIQSPVNQEYGQDPALPANMDDVSTPLEIGIPAGTYSIDGFADILQERLRSVVTTAFREVSDITVTVNEGETGVFAGFDIKFTQVGNGSGLTDKPVASEWGAYIDSSTKTSNFKGKTYGADQHTGNFVASASGTDVLITGYKAENEFEACDVIGKAHPLSQVNSQCVIYFNGSTTADTNDGYTLGLIRAQGKTVSGVKTDYGNPGANPLQTLDNDINIDDDVNVPPSYSKADEANPPFFWDVAFNWVNGSDGQVIHYVNDNDGDQTEGQMKTIVLQNTPTNASLEAKYWDRVIFEVSGQNVTVKLGLTGSGTTTTLVDTSVSAFGSRVKPLGITCNQLFPKIAIQNNDDTNPGTAWLTTWNGHSTLAYYDNNYWGMNGVNDGDEPENGTWGDVHQKIDMSSRYADGTDANGTLVTTYIGELASNAGIANKWSIIMATSRRDGVDSDIYNYFTSPEQERDLYENAENIRRILGLGVITTETDNATVTSGGAVVTFDERATTPSFVGSGSMFVRLKNHALNSYNGNKGSISNIIYSCPRFDAQGNTDGLLFYEPHSEKVYVKFNNASDFILNSLAIDIVDVNEKPIGNLMGNTLVTLHIRKSK